MFWNFRRKLNCLNNYIHRIWWSHYFQILNLCQALEDKKSPLQLVQMPLLRIERRGNIMVYNLLTCKEPFFKNHLCSTENVGLSARFWKILPIIGHANNRIRAFWHAREIFNQMRTFWLRGSWAKQGAALTSQSWAWVINWSCKMICPIWSL